MSDTAPLLRINNRDYIIIKQLGSPGLFASVFLAESKQSDKIAIKFLHPEWLEEESVTELIGRFVREAIILDYLEENRIKGPVRLLGISPACVDFAFEQDREKIKELREKYKAGKVAVDILPFLAELEEETSKKKFDLLSEFLPDIPGGLPYLAIEYIDDNYQHLGQIILRGLGIDIKVGVGICRQFAHLLKDIHELNMAYSDLKESHIFWNGENIKVIDWNASFLNQGLLVKDEEKSNLLQKQLEDIYLFAKVMYHLFLGQEYVDLPEIPTSNRKNGISLAGIIANIESNTSLDFGDLDDRTPFGLKVLLERALAQKDERRYPTATSIISDLELIFDSTREWGDLSNMEVSLVSKLGQKADGKRAQGVPALRTKGYNDALSKFKESLFYIPSLITAAYYLEAYLRGIESDKAAGEVIFARSLLENGEYSSALSTLRESLSPQLNQFTIVIEEIVNLISRAHDYEGFGKLKEATDSYIHVLLNDYECQIAKEGLAKLQVQQKLINRIQVAIQQDNFESARLLLEEFDVKEKNTPLYGNLAKDIQYRRYINRGNLNFQNDRFDKAEEDAQKAFEIKGDETSRKLKENASSMSNAVAVVEDALVKGDYVVAREAAKIMAALDPDSKMVVQLQYRILTEEKIYESIRSLIESGQKAIDENNWDGAQDNFEKALNIFSQPEMPSNAFLRRYKTQVVSELERIAKSRDRNNNLQSDLSREDFEAAIKDAEQISSDKYKEILRAKRLYGGQKASYSTQRYKEALEQIEELGEIEGIKDFPWFDSLSKRVEFEKNSLEAITQLIHEGLQSVENSQWDVAKSRFTAAIQNAQSLPRIQTFAFLTSQPHEELNKISKFQESLDTANNAFKTEKFDEAIKHAKYCLQIYEYNKEAQSLLERAQQNQEQWKMIDSTTKEIKELFIGQYDLDTLIYKINQLPQSFKSDRNIEGIIDKAKKLKDLFDKAEASLNDGSYTDATEFAESFLKIWEKNPRAKKIRQLAENKIRERQEVENAKNATMKAWSDQAQGHGIAIRILESQLSKSDNTDLSQLLRRIKLDMEDFNDLTRGYREFQDEIQNGKFQQAKNTADKINELINKHNRIFSTGESKQTNQLISDNDQEQRQFNEAFPSIEKGLQLRTSTDLNKLNEAVREFREAYRLYRKESIKKLIEDADATRQKVEDVEGKIKAAKKAVQRRDYVRSLEILEGEDDSNCRNFAQTIRLFQNAFNTYNIPDYDKALDLYKILQNTEEVVNWIPDEQKSIVNQLTVLNQRENNKVEFTRLVGERRMDDAYSLLNQMDKVLLNDQWVRPLLDKFRSLFKLIEYIGDLPKSGPINEDLMKYIRSQPFFNSETLKESDSDVQLILNAYMRIANADLAYRDGSPQKLEAAISDIDPLRSSLLGIKKLSDVVVNLYNIIESRLGITRRIDDLIDSHQYDLAFELLNSTTLSTYLQKRLFNIQNNVAQEFDETYQNCIEALIYGKYDVAIKLRDRVYHLKESGNLGVDLKLHDLSSKFQQTARSLMSEGAEWYRHNEQWESVLIASIEDIPMKGQLENGNEQLAKFSALNSIQEEAQFALNLDPENRNAQDLFSKIRRMNEAISEFQALVHLINLEQTSLGEIKARLENYRWSPEVRIVLQKYAAVINFLIPSLNQINSELAHQLEREEYSAMIARIDRIENALVGKGLPSPQFFITMKQDMKVAGELNRDGNQNYKLNKYEEALISYTKLVDIQRRYLSWMEKILSRVIKATSAEIALQDCTRIIERANQLLTEFSDAKQEENYPSVKKKLDDLQRLYPRWDKYELAKKEVHAIIQDRLEQGYTLRKEKDDKEARKAYQDVLNLDPKNELARKAFVELDSRKRLVFGIAGGFVILLLVVEILSSPVYISVSQLLNHPTSIKTVTATPTPIIASTQLSTTGKTTIPAITPTVASTESIVPSSTYPKGITANHQLSVSDSPIKANSITYLFNRSSVFICGTYYEIKTNVRMYLVGDGGCNESELQGWISARYITLEIDTLPNDNPLLAIASLDNASIGVYSEDGKTQIGRLAQDTNILLCGISKSDSTLFGFSKNLKNKCNNVSGWVKSNQIALIITPVYSAYSTPTP